MKRLLLGLALLLASSMALAAININTATKEELTTIKGIGDKRAQEIIDYRKKNGDFKSVDELEKVPGIGPGTMKQIRSQVTVSGKTATDKAADKGTKTSDVKKSETSKADSTKSDTAKTKTSADSAKSDSMKSDPAKTKSAEKK